MSQSNSTPAPAYGVGDASYQAAGREAGIRQLVHDFYEAMDQLPQASKIRAMHPVELEMSKDKLSCFLCGWLGGPKLYNEKYGRIHIPVAHSHIPIGTDERDAWMLCMAEALNKQPFLADFKGYLLEQLAVPAERCRNSK